MLQCKTYSLFTFPKTKTKIKMVAKEWTDDKTFQFRNDLFCTGLGENYFLWVKTFYGNKLLFVQSKYCVNKA